MARDAYGAVPHPTRLEPRRSYEQHEYYREREQRQPEPVSRDRAWLYVALGLGLAIIAAAFTLSLFFAGATVSVFPKQDTVVAHAAFDAGQGASLGFERMTVERTVERTIAAATTKNVEERATGKLIIYNDYAEMPQRLIKNTRFESATGNIYRIRESVEVPGKTAAGPGSVEVTIVAEEPGEQYNTAPGSFTIPGFVGLPQEGKVYGKTTGDIAGGFSGERRVVDDAERANIVTEIEANLRDQLLAAAFETSDRPADHLLFKEAVFFEFVPKEDVPVEGDKVTISRTGKLHGVLFKQDAFATAMARAALTSYGGESIRLENPQDLQVTVVPANTATGTTPEQPWESPVYHVSVEGKAGFVWEFDAAALARDLAGKPKSVLEGGSESIRSTYPGIDHLQANVRPFWKSTFPERPEDIKIITELDG